LQTFAEAYLEEEEFNNEANIVFANSPRPKPNVESIQIEKEPEDVMNSIDETLTTPNPNPYLYVSPRSYWKTYQIEEDCWELQ
jgi:hypothetical protein